MDRPSLLFGANFLKTKNYFYWRNESTDDDGDGFGHREMPREVMVITLVEVLVLRRTQCCLVRFLVFHYLLCNMFHYVLCNRRE